MRNSTGDTKSTKGRPAPPVPGLAFDAAAFVDPPSHLWPGYFWILNDRISTDKLLAQLRDMRARDARSVCLLAEPPEFRPVTLATELDLPYLSDEYFGMIRTVLAECERLGMSFWLYDEGGWPSGGAAGRVLAANPERHGLKPLVFTESEADADGRHPAAPGALCMAAWVDGTWRVHPPDRPITGLPPRAKVRVFAPRSDPVLHKSARCAPYADMLCPEAVAEFISLTHERFKCHTAGHFGKTVRFAFTDEPSCECTRVPHQLTWTSDMATVFSARKGYDIVPLLPRLFVPQADGEDSAVTQARVDFHDVWSQLLVERYLLPVRDWCRANGIVSAGHFGGEDEPRYNADGGFGHILRALRGLDLPGVDAIWRQLYPGLRSHHFTKYASSVARQTGQPYVMTESFAVYGNGLTPAEMKWVTDQQYVRGANLMVVACYPYSTRDHFMPGERPHFGPVNPLWKYMDLYHAYAARLGYLLSRGRAACATAVYYDIRSIWAGGTARAEAIRLHDATAQTFLEAQCDFDFIDDDVLSGKCGRIDGGKLVVGEMAYDTIIVPPTRWMDDAAKQGLEEFRRAGGVVLDRAPADAAPGRVCRIDPASPHIRACRRDWGRTRLYFLTNESDAPAHVTARFADPGAPVLCNPEDGRRYGLDHTRERDGVAVHLDLAAWGSAALLFGADAVADAPLARFERKGAFRLDSGWTIRPLCQYRVGEHDFEQIGRGDEMPMETPLGDWAGVLSTHFSGDVEYAVTFECEADRARIDLGDVKYACRITLNGEPVGRRIWKPFSLDLTGKLRRGRNDLRVVVTNTLANALLAPEVVARWDAMPGPGWPSSGASYDAKARRFEKDSLPSGLYGPVEVEWC